MKKEEKIRLTHRIQNQVLKRIKKEMYKREDKFCFSLRRPHDATIRAVALYSLEGLISDLNREYEDKKIKDLMSI